MIAEPNDTAGENQAEKQETASGYLPVAFSENEIAVAFVLFSSCLQVELAFHLLFLPTK